MSDIQKDEDITAGLRDGTTAPLTSGGFSDSPHWIAGFRVIRKLGEGGMGIVYEVEQQDPRRSVALKVIRGGRNVDEHAVRLFQREAQSLARLKHPRIAAIYQAGQTDDGQRYFAMELVQGTPLHKYLNANPLAGPDVRGRLRARLTIFIELCEAINYAHQRGVIHRDLKPGNIIVLEEGESATGPSPGKAPPHVKVLDFGLARITEPEADGATALTEVGQIQGTLAYMSPEQARGQVDEIDLRADVYSLGVILYEMLADHAPYETRGLMIHEAVRVIQDQAPRRPSTYVKALHGELETIVLKALEKEPDRRYQSALALAEDIERYLTNQPILARPPGTAYQIRKLIVRHKTVSTFAAVLFVLLAGFAATMSVMFETQRRERMRADGERDKAEQINSFLQQMLSSIDPQKARGHEVTVREVLDEAAGGIDTGLREQPEVAAAVRSTIGRTYMALGRYNEAEPHLRRALATRDSILGGNDLEVASAANDLGALMLKKGDYDAAYPLFKRDLEIKRRVLGNEDTEVATSLNDLSLFMKDRGRYAAAESLARSALEIRRKALGASSPDLAVSLGNLAEILRVEGKPAEAEPYCREALAMSRALYGDRHPDVALGLNNLALLLEDEGRYAPAESLMREALAIGKAVLGDAHPSVAYTVNNLALVLTFEGKYKEAESLYREALALYRKQLGSEHPLIASTLNNLGKALQDQGRSAEAEILYRQSLAMRRRLFGEEHPAVALTLTNLASALDDEGKLAEAEPLYRQALAMRRKLLGDTHPYVANSLNLLGALLLDKREPEAAEPLLRECLAIRRGSRSKEDWQLAAAGSALGQCLAMEHRYREAESLLVNSERILSASPAAPAKMKREALTRVIDLFETWGKPGQAAPYRERLRQIERR